MRIALFLRWLMLLSSAGCLSACGANLSPVALGDPMSPVQQINTSTQSIVGSKREPTSSIPWQSFATPAKAEPFLAKGTGEFIASAPKYEISPTRSGSETVTLNLLNAPIAEAAKTVLGDILKVNYSLSDKIAGTITVQTTAPVSKDALIDIFESVLKANGANITKGSGYYRIEPTSNLALSGSPAFQGGQRELLGLQSRIVPLKNISAAEAKKIIEPVAPQGAVVRVDEARNIIVVSGTARELDDILNQIAVFDVDWLKGMSFAMFPIKTSDPEAIVKDLETVFGIDKKGPLYGVVRFIPNRRLGMVLAISSNKAQLDTARTWIEKLDRIAESTEEKLFVYKVQNRSAVELAQVLSSLLSGDATEQSKVTPAGAGPTGGLSSNLFPASNDNSGSWPIGGQNGNSGPDVTAAAGSESAASPLARSSPNKMTATTQFGNRFVADEQNNALLIKATPKEYSRVLLILEKVDVQPTQVMLEAMIAEVTLNDELKFGVKWYLENHRSQFALSDVVSGAVQSTFPGFSYFFSANNVKIALDAVSGITKVNVVSAPSLMVLDSHKAVLQIGDQVPIVTQTAQGVTQPDSPVVNSVSFRDTGVILAVTPRVSDSGSVVLDVEQEVSNVTKTTSSGIDSPTIQQRRVRTTVVVTHGEVLTLGGLIQERDNVSKTQVPMLGNIPVIGTLFGQKSDSIDRTELLIFIRPVVVRNAAAARAVTEEFRDRVKLRAPLSQREPEQFSRDAIRILR